MPPRRKRYLDNVAPADNTARIGYNPVMRVKQKDTPARRDKETREYQAKVERGQRIMNTFARTPAGRRAANRAYAIESQKAKQEAAKEEAAAVVQGVLGPTLPSYWLNMLAAAKNGQVNNLTDALAAPYLSDSWSMRNPGKALITDILIPIGFGLAGKASKLKLGIVPDEIRGLNMNSTPIITRKNYMSVPDEMWDVAYNNAINKGNKREIQRLRDLHFMAKANQFVATPGGDVKPLYRGYGRGEDIKVSPIMKGRNGVWLTEDKEYAGNYTKLHDLVQAKDAQGHVILDEDGWPIDEWFEYGVPDYSKVRKYYAKGNVEEAIDRHAKFPKIYSAYGQNVNTDLSTNVVEAFRKKANRMMAIDYPDLAEKLRFYGNDITFSDYLNKMGPIATKQYRLGTADIIKGYDIPLWDEGWINSDLPVYNVKNPAYVKSANPITYDNKGNIIPLSKRDNFRIRDARYGLLPFIGGGLGFSLYNKK